MAYPDPSMRAQAGSHGLPVIMSKAGKLFEFEPARLDAGGRPVVADSDGKTVPIGRIELDQNRKPILIDMQGKTVVGTKPIIRTGLAKSPIAQKVTIGERTIFLGPTGDVIEPEEGQAGGSGVLLTQSGSLIYYSSIVNDVYAYFLTGTKNGGITPAPTQFPTTQAELNKIITFAGLAGPHKTTFPDPNALCVELKTSWVETAGLPNVSGYITTTGTIPTYDKSVPGTWTPNGQKTVQLALVGMHFVGSASGHPEMIWASFEHFGNSPNTAIRTTQRAGRPRKPSLRALRERGYFAANGATGNFNNLLQRANGAVIQSTTSGQPIKPGNILRQHPFGGSSGQTPNPLVASIADSNAQAYDHESKRAEPITKRGHPQELLHARGNLDRGWASSDWKLPQR